MLNKDSSSWVDETTNIARPIERRNFTQDLLGLCCLSHDAIHKTTELVEAQHSRLDWFSNCIFPDRGVDKIRNPITAISYNSIYAVNSIVFTILNLIVSRVEPVLEEEIAFSQRRQRAIAILNGVIGDYLKIQRNPLAISLQWRTLDIGNSGDGSPTELDQTVNSKAISSPRQHFLLLIHGCCSSPQDWWQQGHNHGISLSNELEYSTIPLFLHYNTGLHISENGKLLSESIQGIVDNSTTASLSLPSLHIPWVG